MRRTGQTDRLYPQHWQAIIFKPAASVEAWLTDSDVEILAPEISIDSCCCER